MKPTQAATGCSPRSAFSNHGSRIDCYAWGDSVTTAGYGALAGDGNTSYTSSFGGTSSASPIISGAALLLQGMYFASTRTLLSPQEMRALLSNPTTGTPQGGGIAGNIGVMPDLQLIIGWRVERHPRFLADLTGDGCVDIVGFGNIGVWISLNNGDGTFQAPQLVVEDLGYEAGGWRVEKHPRFLADLTGMGGPISSGLGTGACGFH